MKTSPRLLWIGAALFLTMAYLAWAAWPRGDRADAEHLRAFGRLPALHEGRVMPLDTFARMNLLAINHKQTYKDDQGTQPAIRWLLDTMVSAPPAVGKDKVRLQVAELLRTLFKTPVEGGPADGLRVFRVENEEVLSTLGLEVRRDLRYTFNEIWNAPEFANFLKRADVVSKTPVKERTLADVKVFELYRHLAIFRSIAGLEDPMLLPLNTKGDDWFPLGPAAYVAQVQLAQGKQPHEATKTLLTLLAAHAAGDVGAFNSTLALYQEQLNRQMPEITGMARLEAYFNEFAPFYHCSILYGLLFLTIAIGWLIGSENLRSAAFWSALVVLLVHTWALAVRMYITGRPPVTNLYSSAVFIGWGSIAICLGVEVLFKNGIALAVGTITGLLSLIVAHLLGLSGDTMEVLQAVLDTNFWLSTHVICITFGYVATFVAGFMGIAYVVLGLTTRALAGEGSRNLSRMIYGVLCFATFLSFTGTVLGGIWADESWGRFWGWDPKENGALMIVLWNALVLHARWGGLVKSRGVALLAVGGNIVTAWSWVGTNLLGVGLHSYGFIQGAFWTMAAFDLAFLGVIVVGLIPLRYWASFRPAVDTFPRRTSEPRHPVLAG